ncbi:MAG: MFS transporter [Candidatus Rokuibacteriota bacterium]|nr:MAG: MFS transporter [Candidatus Rokubacteria bacterium]PYN79492.1 MAG: MFS transporter [Candidatus Rokubacteria bacterium]
MEADMATIAAQQQAKPQALSAAGWRALVASFLGWLFDGYETYALILVAAVALRQLLEPQQLASLPIYIGGLLAVTLVGWATGGIVAGVLADYIGRKRVLMLSILWYALFTGLTALATSYASFMILRFLTGLGLGAEWGPGTAILGESWPPRSRGRAASVLQSAFAMGLVLASVVWLYVAPLGPSAWRAMFLIGVLPALSVLWIRRSVRESDLWVAARDRRQLARQRLAGGHAVSADDRALTGFTVKRILLAPDLRRRLALLLVLSICTIVAWWAVSTWIPFYAGQIAAKAGGNAQRWVALAGLYYNLGAILGFVVFGVLADTWGRKPTMVLYYAGSIVLVVVLFRVVQDPFTFLMVAAVNGFFTVGQFAWMPVYLPELFPTDVRGSAISLVFDVTRYLAAAGPLLAGWLIVSLGGMSTAASIFGLAYVVGMIVTPFVAPETKGRPLPA